MILVLYIKDLLLVEDVGKVGLVISDREFLYPFSHNHGPVEMCPKLKETSMIGGTPFPLNHDGRRKWNQKLATGSGSKYVLFSPIYPGK